ncbi:hypothetical protein AVEN_193112-1 [Araneus ventricosus]|uniref:Uncharacterized protein n=1 Tax=Araneus ventricosus TaxID=182803 RepID=A0A4Y2B2F3_ARAVE|nr:hypothetical protein AVEN_193112-1 [Araneus ventricosus]
MDTNRSSPRNIVFRLPSHLRNCYDEQLVGKGTGKRDTLFQTDNPHGDSPTKRILEKRLGNGAMTWTTSRLLHHSSPRAKLSWDLGGSL